jgi:recombinational DNA repair protein RecT
VLRHHYWWRLAPEDRGRMCSKSKKNIEFGAWLLDWDPTAKRTCIGCGKSKIIGEGVSILF